MKRYAVLIAAFLAASIAAPHPVLAQGQPPADKSQPMTGMKPDRTTADTATRKKMQSKEAGLKKKRAGCRSQATAKKVPVLKRHAFVEKCMSSR
jgi:uncharacterized protein involved in copper resistance